MSFWKTSTGDDAAETASTEYDIGGSIVIPDDSTVLAIVESAMWRKDASFNEYIELTWAVLKPDEVAKAKVWQKLWVKDADPRAKDRDAADKKRDNALRMLATIDANAGGKLARSGREPEDDDLALALTNKPMTIKVKVWEMNGSSGNWIAAVMPKDRPLELGKAAPKPSGGVNAKPDLGDDEIPF